MTEIKNSLKNNCKMKKTLCIILLGLFSINLSAQKTVHDGDLFYGAFMTHNFFKAYDSIEKAVKKNCSGMTSFSVIEKDSCEQVLSRNQKITLLEGMVYAKYLLANTNVFGLTKEKNSVIQTDSGAIIIFYDNDKRYPGFVIDIIKL